MPSLLHEVMVTALRDRPGLVWRLAGEAFASIPRGEEAVRFEDTSLTEIAPTA